MCLVASVCVCMCALCGQNFDLFRPYILFEKNPCCVDYITWSWNLNDSKVVFSVLRVVQVKQFMRDQFKASSGILHYGMPCLICNVMHYATCSQLSKALPLWDRQRRHYRYTCSSPLTVHSVRTCRVCVLWNLWIASKLRFQITKALGCTLYNSQINMLTRVDTTAGRCSKVTSGSLCGGSWPRCILCGEYINTIA